MRQLHSDLWTRDAPQRFFGVEVGARMTVVRLPGPRLLLHSPVPAAPELLREVEALGPVAYLVAPNKFHHLSAGDWQRARQYLEAALDGDSSYKQALLNLGLISVRQGSYDEAVATFGKVMGKPEVYERIGALCLVEGNFDDADRFLNLAIASSPTYYKEAYDTLEKLHVLREAANTPKRAAPRRIKTSFTAHEFSFAESEISLIGKDDLYPPDLSIGTTRRPSRFTLDQSVWR